MASAIRQLAGMGGDVRKIAALLKKKAPPGHILAYITPQEAQLLKARGGSGKEHENTGILSFEEEFTDYGGEFDSTATSGGEAPAAETPAFEPGSAAYMASEAQNVSLPNITQELPAQEVGAGRTPYGGGVDLFAGEQVETPVFAPPSYSDYGAPTGFGAPGTAYETAGVPSVAGAEKAVPEEEGLGAKAEKLSKYLDKNKGLTQLLGAGAMGLGALYRGRQGAKQAESLRSELGALGEQYKTQGQELMRRGQTGELTPAQQRQVQALRAQAAQGAERRGGVGAQQSEAQIQAYAQQLSQQNIDQGIRLMGIADQYQAAAIKAGYTASKDAQAASDRFYAAMSQFLVSPNQPVKQRAE